MSNLSAFKRDREQQRATHRNPLKWLAAGAVLCTLAGLFLLGLLIRYLWRWL